VAGMEMTANQVELFDFPIVERQGKKRSALRQMLDAIDKHGPLCPQSFVHGFLGLSKSRISQFIQEERLAVVEIAGKNFVPFASLDLFLTEERKNGRPIEIPNTFSEFRKNLK
jgi:hypothetical protein